MSFIGCSILGLCHGVSDYSVIPFPQQQPSFLVHFNLFIHLFCLLQHLAFFCLVLCFFNHMHNAFSFGSFLTTFALFQTISATPVAQFTPSSLFHPDYLVYPNFVPSSHAYSLLRGSNANSGSLSNSRSSH